MCSYDLAVNVNTKARPDQPAATGLLIEYGR